MNSHSDNTEQRFVACPAEHHANKNGVDLDATITRRELIAWVDEGYKGMDSFMDWLVGDSRCWPNFVEGFR